MMGVYFAATGFGNKLAGMVGEASQLESYSGDMIADKGVFNPFTEKVDIVQDTNGDGVKEYWQVKGISAQFQPNSKIFIFDRFGKLLSEIDPLGPGWDGTFNGFNMPASDYWFAVTLEDGRVFKSHFALRR